MFEKREQQNKPRGSEKAAKQHQGILKLLLLHEELMFTRYDLKMYLEQSYNCLSSKGYSVALALHLMW